MSVAWPMKHRRSEGYCALRAVRKCDAPGKYLGHECPGYAETPELFGF